MSNEPPDFWFPVKRIGWGWGPPVRWQGWLVLAGYFGLTIAGIRHFREQRDGRGLLVYVAVITVVLVLVIIAKGERQSRE